MGSDPSLIFGACLLLLTRLSNVWLFDLTCVCLDRALLWLPPTSPGEAVGFEVAEVPPVPLYPTVSCNVQSMTADKTSSDCLCCLFIPIPSYELCYKKKSCSCERLMACGLSIRFKIDPTHDSIRSSAESCQRPRGSLCLQKMTMIQ